MKTKLNLKKCPFCGGKAKMRHGLIGYHVECETCKARQCPSDTPETAVKNWNRRTARGLAKRIEHAVYDYVVWVYGKSEAFDPSWSIPDLARSVAEDLVNPAYTPANKLTYSWEDK